MGYVDHVVRRGLQHPAAASLIKRVQEGPKIEVPGWGIAILVSTFVAFVFFLSAVGYPWFL